MRGGGVRGYSSFDLRIEEKVEKLLVLFPVRIEPKITFGVMQVLHILSNFKSHKFVGHPKICNLWDTKDFAAENGDDNICDHSTFSSYPLFP